MSFSDPFALPFDGTTVELTRISGGPSSSVLQSPDGNLSMTISHQYGKRIRRTVRLDHNVVGADPLLSDVNNRYSMSTYVVWDVPTFGIARTKQRALIDSLGTQIGDGDGDSVFVNKILAGEY